MTAITTGFTADERRRGVSAAAHAPSQHDGRPWRLRLRDGGIEVYADRDRRISDRAAYLACGAATFNVRLALAAAGIVPRVRLLPYPDEPDLVARLEPDRYRAAAPHEHALYAAVRLRHTSRVPFWSEPVPLDVRWRLVEAARAEGAWVELVVGASAARVDRTVHAAPRPRPGEGVARLAHPNGGSASQHRPGRAAGHGRNTGHRWGGGRAWHGGEVEPEPLVAVVGSAGDSAVDQVVAGQALQRMLLTAANAELTAPMMSQPIEVPSAREQLRRALGRFGVPQVVLRIGYGQPGRPTPRRSAEEGTDRP
jgi:hypothetical protein